MKLRLMSILVLVFALINLTSRATETTSDNYLLDAVTLESGYVFSEDA